MSGEYSLFKVKNIIERTRRITYSVDNSLRPEKRKEVVC